MFYRNSQQQKCRAYNTHRKHNEAGFSLIEVLITSLIIGIMSAIVVIKHGSFNSSVLLKNQAYEIALALREAQVFSISIRGTEDGGSNQFRDPYGVHFDLTSGPTQQFIIFLDDNNNNQYDSGTDPTVESFVVDSRFEIHDMCVEPTSGTDDCYSTSDLDELTFTFARPDFDAKYHAVNGGSTVSGTFVNGWVVLRSVSDLSIIRTVMVGAAGQISVQ